MRLSAFAAQVLSEKGILDVNKLELHREFLVDIVILVTSSEENVFVSAFLFQFIYPFYSYHS